MINFFRKKRKILADDNKALKYTRYAIGEIVLVVIGILIALSINNWNEQRKIKNEETVILQSLLKDLTIAKKQSEDAINKEEIAFTNLLAVLSPGYFEGFDSNTLKADSLFYNIIWNFDIAIPVINTYTDIKSAGKSGLITNNEIRNSFSSLEFSIYNLTDIINDRTKVHQFRIDAISVQEINFIRFLNTTIPNANLELGEDNDYKKVLENQYVRNLIGIKTQLTNNTLKNRKLLNDEIISLIHLIESELNTKKK